MSQTDAGRWGGYIDVVQVAEHEGVSGSTPVFSPEGLELACEAEEDVRGSVLGGEG